MALGLGHRSVPSSIAVLKAEAERFLAGCDIGVLDVYRVERETANISWLLFTTAGGARYAVVSGEGPSSWELVNEGAGWPVV